MNDAVGFAVTRRRATLAGACVGALCHADGRCEAPVLPEGSPLVVRVTRRLATLFQGLSWDQVDEAERVRAILRNLTDGVTTTIEVSSG